jgi:hypothetical protein
MIAIVISGGRARSYQVEHQDLGRLLPDESEAVLVTHRRAIALSQSGPVTETDPWATWTHA